MDAIIGRYRVRLEESGLVLKHSAGISFDLTIDETIGLWDFINVYRKTLLSMQGEADSAKVELETDPLLKRISAKEDGD